MESRCEIETSDPHLLDVPLRLGARLELHVPEPNAPPKIAAPTVMSKPWPRTAFEQFAVPRGFL